MPPDKGIFETLAESGVPISLAAHAEARAEQPPSTHAQLTKLISYVFWLGVLAIIEFALIVGLVIALLV